MKASVHSLHRKWIGDGFACICPVCDKPIENGWDLHEAIVARSAVPKDKQHLIMVRENCIPLHHTCHLERGNTELTTQKCIIALCRNIGADKVGGWYTSLWQKHDLSVPRGLLVPKKDHSVNMVMHLMNVGSLVLGKGKLIVEEWNRRDDKGQYNLLSQAAVYWIGKRPRWRRKAKDISGDLPELLKLIYTGYWVTYLLGIAGLDNPMNILYNKDN